MLYHLLTPLAERFSFLNVFVYITFRAAGATVTAILISLVAGPWIIRRLRERSVGEVIRADGPSSHQKKRGTPTMGGILILVATVVPTLLWARLDTSFVPVAVGAILWMGVMGFVDDYLKVVQGKSRGLVARYKLIGQVIFGIALATFLLMRQLPGALEVNETTVPFFKFYTITLPPLLYVGFVTFVITASTNAVNLTDGLDGLAAGLTVIAAAAFAIFAYIFGNVRASEYLYYYYLPGAGELAIFCASLMGAALGFLWYNAHPADVFMGDTGSLAIGGAFGVVSILLKSEFLLLLIGGVFAAETASVLLQTGVFRWRRRRHGLEYARAHRLFRMTPIHHHFEKLGWPESKIVSRFYILGILCALLALATTKLR